MNNDAESEELQSKTKNAEAETQNGISKTQSGKLEIICERCGCKMYESNCKVVCPNCGNRFDCSDLNIYFD